MITDAHMKVVCAQEPGIRNIVVQHAKAQVIPILLKSDVNVVIRAAKCSLQLFNKKEAFFSFY
jgi:hypothetical protein